MWVVVGGFQVAAVSRVALSLVEIELGFDKTTFKHPRNLDGVVIF